MLSSHFYHFHLFTNLKHSSHFALHTFTYPFLLYNSTSVAADKCVIISASFQIIFCFFFHFCLNPGMDSCGAFPQQQQLHGLHPLRHREQRLQPELISQRLRPPRAVQQARPGEVHGRLPAARGRVECESPNIPITIELSVPRGWILQTLRIHLLFF